MRRPVAPDDVAAIRRIAAAAEEADGHPALGDAVWRDLAQPTPASAVCVASVDDEPVGVLHLAPPENDGEAIVTLSFVVHPEHRAENVERALLDAALADPSVRDRRVVLWCFGADDAADRLAASLGFVPERELRQMRVPLPLPLNPAWPPGIEVRPFRPGVDDHVWLTVNNRAFADDPDQRGWTIDVLRRRQREPWFDPGGFLLAWRGDALAGFCWTKLHPASPPRAREAIGEIYVIGVDPDHQGGGLGRALVVGGLAALHERGATVGMLFVEVANAAAVALYETLGFTIARVDRAYSREPS